MKDKFLDHKKFTVGGRVCVSWDFPEKQSQKNIYRHLLQDMVLEVEKFHGLQSINWITEKASGKIESKCKGLRIGGK